MYPLTQCPVDGQLIDASHHRHSCPTQILVLGDGTADLDHVVAAGAAAPNLVPCDGLSGWEIVYRRGNWLPTPSTVAPWCNAHAARLAEKMNSIRDGAAAVQAAVDGQALEKSWAERAAEGDPEALADAARELERIAGGPEGVAELERIVGQPEPVG